MVLVIVTVMSVVVMGVTMMGMVVMGMLCVTRQSCRRIDGKLANEAAWTLAQKRGRKQQKQQQRTSRIQDSTVLVSDMERIATAGSHDVIDDKTE